MPILYEKHRRSILRFLDRQTQQGEESEQSESEDILVLIEKKISTKHDEPVLIIELPKSLESAQGKPQNDTPKKESKNENQVSVSLNNKGSVVSFGVNDNPCAVSFG